MAVDIITVNWNSGDMLAACVASVREHHGGLAGKFIIVDNDSTDGSVEFLERAADIDLIRAEENLGFGRACNLGASKGGNPFILLLNPDARLVDGSLQTALSFMWRPENSSVGIVGVQLIGDDGAVQRTCARFPGPWRLVTKSLGLTKVLKSADYHMITWDHLETRVVDHVIGAFFVVRRDLFERLGGMDERFFVYLEDLDFSLRARQQGYSSVYLTTTQAYHKGGGVSEQVKAHRLFYSLRSRIQYAAKHFSRTGAVAVTTATLVIEPLSRAIGLLLFGRFGEVRDLGRGYLMLWRWWLRQLARAGR